MRRRRGLELRRRCPDRDGRYRLTGHTDSVELGLTRGCVFPGSKVSSASITRHGQGNANARELDMSLANEEWPDTGMGENNDNCGGDEAQFGSAIAFERHSCCSEVYTHGPWQK